VATRMALLLDKTTKAFDFVAPKAHVARLI